jgi:hypothetical protein
MTARGGASPTAAATGAARTVKCDAQTAALRCGCVTPRCDTAGSTVSAASPHTQTARRARGSEQAEGDDDDALS